MTRSGTTSDTPNASESVAESAIKSAFARISAEIEACTNPSGRAVRLLAVSKTRTAEEIEQAYLAGAREFGENYLQDAAPKQKALARYTDIAWHYIGAIQSNKTTDIANLFDWVHTVDREKIARRLSNARGSANTPLNICLQVNLHDEAQKAGCLPAALPDLLQSVCELPNLALRGLMIIPAQHVEPEEAFVETAALFSRLQEQPGRHLPHWDTLSMGMSSDYPAAIAAGSTIVRIGTALFGPRTSK